MTVRSGFPRSFYGPGRRGSAGARSEVRLGLDEAPGAVETGYLCPCCGGYGAHETAFVCQEGTDDCLCVTTPEGPCIFVPCVSRERHWHGFMWGGYDNPADPDGAPIPFTREPAPGVRDYNGAILGAAFLRDEAAGGPPAGSDSPSRAPRTGQGERRLPSLGRIR